MFPQDRPKSARVGPKTYPLGEINEPRDCEHALALIALSHTPAEHRLYNAMLSPAGDSNSNQFTAKNLMALTGIGSLTTVRRGLGGLLSKLSIERQAIETATGKRSQV